MSLIKRLLFMTVVTTCVACSVNPVTGKKEWSPLSPQGEVTLGEQNYKPYQQQQGGRYVVDPDLNAYVNQVGQKLARVSDRPDLPYEFVVLNHSTPNAWALPGGKIAVNRGLLTELGSEAELAAVLGHEVVHAAARHSAQAASRSALVQGAVILGSVAVGVATENDNYTTVAMLGGTLGAQLVQQRHSRDAEREADYYGMIYMQRAGYDPSAAVELQETFVRLSGDRQSSSFEGLFASHPPSPERVENNRRTVAELGSGGNIGRQSHQQAVASLKRLEPAYQAHDAGRQALADGRVDEALARADEALSIENGEALFHALRGDALATRGDFSAAEQAYSSALSHDSGWFYHHLRRGMAREQLQQWAAARSDLQASLERLQTADGHLHLGLVEQADGRRQQAIEHFRVAAQSDTPAGQRARQALVEMGAAQ